MSRDLPLQGLRVLELGSFFTAPLVGTLLRQLGAEVIKVEPPGGEAGRQLPPYLGGGSVPFHAINAGKSIQRLNLKSEAGRHELGDLVSHCDILVDNLTPASLAAFGIAEQIAGPRNDSDVIWCSIRGAENPIEASSDLASRAVDLTVQAASGLAWLMGDAGMPRRLPVPAIDVATALMASVNILAALPLRPTGYRIIVSMLTVAALLESPILASVVSGAPVAPLGMDNFFVVPNGVFRVRDGHVAVAVYTQSSWEAVVSEFQLEADDDLDLATLKAADRLAQRESVNVALAQGLEKCEGQEVLVRMHYCGAACARVRSVHDALSLPDVGAVLIPELDSDYLTRIQFPLSGLGTRATT